MRCEPLAGLLESITRSRLLAQQLSEGLGQQVIIDNCPGGGGIISAEITAHANPDGYTPLYTRTSFSVLPGLHKKLPYDPVGDFALYIQAQITKWSKVVGVAGVRAD